MIGNVVHSAFSTMPTIQTTPFSSTHHSLAFESLSHVPFIVASQFTSTGLVARYSNDLSVKPGLLKTIVSSSIRAVKGPWTSRSGRGKLVNEGSTRTQTWITFKGTRQIFVKMDVVTVERECGEPKECCGSRSVCEREVGLGWYIVDSKRNEIGCTIPKKQRSHLLVACHWVWRIEVDRHET